MTEKNSSIGLSKLDLDTPALLVDLDILEANIAHVSATCRTHGVGWRPHTKAHKSPDIARKQIAAGAIGITCAKLGEGFHASPATWTRWGWGPSVERGSRG